MRKPTIGRPGATRLLLVLAGLLAACGVGPVKETSFAYGAIGPEGGTLTAGELTLTIPAGAVTAPTAIAVVPSSTALPIVPPAGDDARYEIAGDQWCCSPQGLLMLADCQLKVGYGVGVALAQTEGPEQVLLLWDEVLQALVPAGDAAVDDPESQTFTVDQYRVLGHVALGNRWPIPVPPPPSDRFAFNAFVPGERGEEPVNGVYEDGLYVASLEGSLPLTQLATDGDFPHLFVPTPTGDRVLYELENYPSDVAQGFRELLSVGLNDAAPKLLAGVDEFVEGQDPTLGWMRDGQRAFFQAWPAFGKREYAPPIEVEAFATVPGDGSDTPTALYPMDPDAWVVDVRQSPDGKLVLIRYWGGGEEELIDVFDAATGASISRGVIPVGATGITPRFLPDSSGVYLVDWDRSTVLRYDPDGTNEATLYDVPSENGEVKDFVLAPNGDEFAYVPYIPFSVVGNSGNAAAPGEDALFVGSLSGGERASLALGGAYTYTEMLFHPSGAHLFLNARQIGVRIFAAADGTEGPSLHAEAISDLDINALDGRLLIRVWEPQSISPFGGRQPAQFLEPGLYVAEADGTGMRLIDLPEDLEVVYARWLRTIRLAPCMGSASLFR